LVVLRVLLILDSACLRLADSLLELPFYSASNLRLWKRHVKTDKSEEATKKYATIDHRLTPGVDPLVQRLNKRD
jgi:hypothetical protein